MLGTATAFSQLRERLHALPGFPCCAFPGSGGFSLDPCHSCSPPRRFPEPVPCVVDDQACLQVVLASEVPSASEEGAASVPSRVDDSTRAIVDYRIDRSAPYPHLPAACCLPPAAPLPARIEPSPRPVSVTA